jgi:ribosomal protein S18 acetylase RimI-like enzyme
MPEIIVKELNTGELLEHLSGLMEVLHTSVNAGASVNFILPYSLDDSRAFWLDKVLPAVQQGGRILLVALLGEKLVGTVQLIIEMPPNQAHRGEVTKLLVHPEFRNRGVARQLMSVLEQRAYALGKRLITLDTRTGDKAEPLYQSLGYQTAGIIPGFARNTEEDRYHSTTYMYKAC